MPALPWRLARHCPRGRGATALGLASKYDIDLANGVFCWCGTYLLRQCGTIRDLLWIGAESEIAKYERRL
jgi:hypothetical protein